MFYVFIDTKNEKIVLFSDDNVVTNVPFTDIHILDEFKNEQVYYITDVMDTTISEVVDLVKNSFDINFKEIPEKKEQPEEEIDNNTSFIHASRDKNIFIDETLVLEGKYHVVLINDNIKEKMKKDPLKKLISKGIVKVINEKQRRDLMKEWDKVSSEKDALKKDADKKLDKILIEDDDAQDLALDAEGSFGNVRTRDVSEDFDVESEDVGSQEDSVLTDAEEIVNNLGIK